MGSAMVRNPCLYPNCLKSTRRREKHDNLPHYKCLECQAVAPRKLQSQHYHPFTTQPLTRPPTPSIYRNNPEPCWCSRCPVQESKNLVRHKKTPHYICETCDSEGGTRVFIGKVIAQRHERFRLGHIVSRTRGPGRPSLEELAATLRESQRIVCVAGAGI